MKPEEFNRRLSSIQTVWTVLHQAHTGTGSEAAAAQQLLMQRYGGAIYRYLLQAVGDPGVADDLTQEFALSLVRGEFHKADPQRGRFRDYVKGVLFHLVSKHRKRQQKQPQGLPADFPEPADTAPAQEFDRAFNENWRDELLARTWQTLAEAQPTYYAVLRFRAAHPRLPSAHMAEQLSCQLAKPLTAAGVRQILHRARDRFAELLVEEVAQSLDQPAPEDVGRELGELELLVYCQSVLEHYFRVRSVGPTGAG